jgi:hypothetical protein
MTCDDAFKAVDQVARPIRASQRYRTLVLGLVLHRIRAQCCNCPFGQASDESHLQTHVGECREAARTAVRNQTQQAADGDGTPFCSRFDEQGLR